MASKGTILFLYGEDTYSSFQKLQALKEKYLSSGGDFNLAVLEGSELTLGEFKNQIMTFPFLASKRLVVVKNLLLEGKAKARDDVLTSLGSLPESTVLVFYEFGLPDARIALFKALNQPRVAQNFKKKTNEEAIGEIEKFFQSLGVEYERAVPADLIAITGLDMWRLHQEVEKLAAYGFKSKKPVSSKDVKALVCDVPQVTIFQLIDKIAEGELEGSLSALYKLISVGQNELYLLSGITGHFRSLLLAKDYAERYGQNSSGLAKVARLHPFVAGKCLKQARFLTLEWLKKAYRELLMTDYKVKTGQIDGSISLDLLVYRLCGKME